MCQDASDPQSKVLTSARTRAPSPRDMRPPPSFGSQTQELHEHRSKQPHANSHVRSPAQRTRSGAPSTTPPTADRLSSPQTELRESVSVPRRPSKAEHVNVVAPSPRSPREIQATAETHISHPPQAHPVGRDTSHDAGQPTTSERRHRHTEHPGSSRSARPSHYDRKIHELSNQLSESMQENKELRRELRHIQGDCDAARIESARFMREVRQLQLQLDERDEDCARLRKRDEDSAASVEAGKKQLDMLEEQLEAQARRLTEAERDLPEREREVRRRESAQSEREAGVSKREAALAEREAKLGEDQGRFNAEKVQFAEEVAQLREEQEAQSRKLARREAEITYREENIEGEADKYSQWTKQIEERERQHIEACKEAQVLRSVRRSSSGGPGKENNELWKQMEEQQDRMHKIKQHGWKQNVAETGAL